MQKQNLSKKILTAILIVVVASIIEFSIFQFSEIKKVENLPANVTKYVEPVENNNNQEPESVELETYQAELFIEAKWGSGEGEVGIESFGGDESGTGIVYGPQSFDVNDDNNHLFILDSINERVIEYDDEGKYLRDFLIGIGATTDIKIKDEYIYILSFGSDAVYKLNMSGKILDSYSLPGKNPGMGNGGIEFDEDGNVMVEINIDGYYDEESRFYEIGKNGSEWKTNSYNGHISRDKKEFYFVKGVDLLTQKIQILDRSGKIQKEFPVKLSQKAYVYYRGCDKEGNIYLSIGYRDSVKMKEGNSDKFIFKYNKNGILLTEIDLFSPLRKFFKDDELFIIPRIYLYANDFKYFRVSDNKDIYWMATFENEGLKIFKYSQIN